MANKPPPFDLGPDDWARINQTLALAPRELEAIQLVCANVPRKAIAKRMGCSKATVDKEIDRAYKKIGVHGRMELLLRCQKLAQQPPSAKTSEKPRL